jgi:hypothetical protein
MKRTRSACGGPSTVRDRCWFGPLAFEPCFGSRNVGFRICHGHGISLEAASVALDPDPGCWHSYAELKTLLKFTLVMIACVGAALTLPVSCSQLQHRGDQISASFICFTNHPVFPLAALVVVTNRSDHVIWCEGHGFLVPGESCTAEILLLTQNEPDQIPVKWQCTDGSRLDAFMNRLRRRAEVFGVKPLRPWFPLMRVSRVSRPANLAAPQPPRARSNPPHPGETSSPPSAPGQPGAEGGL